MKHEFLKLKHFTIFLLKIPFQISKISSNNMYLMYHIYPNKTGRQGGLRDTSDLAGLAIQPCTGEQQRGLWFRLQEPSLSPKIGAVRVDVSPKSLFQSVSCSLATLPWHCMGTSDAAYPKPLPHPLPNLYLSQAITIHPRTEDTPIPPSPTAHLSSSAIRSSSKLLGNAPHCLAPMALVVGQGPEPC